MSNSSKQNQPIITISKDNKLSGTKKIVIRNKDGRTLEACETLQHAWNCIKFWQENPDSLDAQEKDIDLTDLVVLSYSQLDAIVQATILKHLMLKHADDFIQTEQTNKLNATENAVQHLALGTKEDAFPVSMTLTCYPNSDSKSKTSLESLCTFPQILQILKQVDSEKEEPQPEHFSL